MFQMDDYNICIIFLFSFLFSDINSRKNHQRTNNVRIFLKIVGGMFSNTDWICILTPIFVIIN